MSALIAVPPQTYRDVLAFLTSCRRTEVRMGVDSLAVLCLYLIGASGLVAVALGGG